MKIPKGLGRMEWGHLGAMPSRGREAAVERLSDLGEIISAPPKPMALMEPRI